MSSENNGKRDDIKGKGKSKKRQANDTGERSLSTGATKAGKIRFWKRKNQQSAARRDSRHFADLSRSSRTSSDDHLELPGFHYDRETKRYYKILPGQSNAGNPNIVTKDSLKKKEEEDKRIQSLRIISENRKVTSTLPHQIRRQSINIVNSVYKREISRRHGLQSVKDFTQDRIPFLSPTSRTKIFKDPESNYEWLEHMQILRPNADFKRVLGLWSLRGSAVQSIRILKVVSKSLVNGVNDSEAGKSIIRGIGVKAGGTAIMKSLSKVTNVCWAPDPSDPTASQILYTTMCILGKFPSIALLRRLDMDTIDEYRSTEFNLGKNATWTCAWSPLRTQFSVGTEKKSILIDVETRRLWELKTNDSDVFSQIFSTSMSPVLYSGTRSGLVCSHDLRSSSAYYVSALVHKSSVCCLRLLQNENYLICSDFSGNIKRWDLRVKKVVQDFSGHVNEYSKIPFNVDEHESILYGAGQDCYTRIWSLKDASLLHTIPPPYPASREIIPSVCFSNRWAGGSQSGLLMGIKDEIHFYSM